MKVYSLITAYSCFMFPFHESLLNNCCSTHYFRVHLMNHFFLITTGDTPNRIKIWAVHTQHQVPGDSPGHWWSPEKRRPAAHKTATVAGETPHPSRIDNRPGKAVATPSTPAARYAPRRCSPDKCVIIHINSARTQWSTGSVTPERFFFTPYAKFLW